MNKQFTIVIKEVPAQNLCGLKTSTSYATAQQDCSKAWVDFCTQHFSCSNDTTSCKKNLDISNCRFGCESYGVSTMTSPGSFDYLVALPQGKSKIPGATCLKLAAGPYAVCECQRLEKITEVYKFIYMNQEEWLKADMPYLLNMNAPCFELYPADFDHHTNTNFYIYAPLQFRK